MPGEFHASEAAHLVAVADKDGDQVLSKEEVGSQKILLLCLVVWWMLWMIMETMEMVSPLFFCLLFSLFYQGLFVSFPPCLFVCLSLLRY